VQLIKDEEGSEHATADEAGVQAPETARELWADAIKAGRSLGADAIVIADENGQLTFVPMPDALPNGLSLPIAAMTELCGSAATCAELIGGRAEPLPIPRWASHPRPARLARSHRPR